MGLKLIIERKIESKDEYEFLKRQSKIPIDTWKLEDTEKNKYLDVDHAEDMEE